VLEPRGAEMQRGFCGCLDMGSTTNPMQSSASFELGSRGGPTMRTPDWRIMKDMK